LAFEIAYKKSVSKDLANLGKAEASSLSDLTSRDPQTNLPQAAEGSLNWVQPHRQTKTYDRLAFSWTRLARGGGI
jgi:hypothetical protein